MGRIPAKPEPAPTADIFVPHSNLVWLDLETTGLLPHRDHILEVGMVVTDGQLSRHPDIPDFQQVVIPHNGLDITKLDPFVVGMHAESGLLAEIAAGKGCRPDQLFDRILNWLRAARNTVYNTMPDEIAGMVSEDYSYQDVKFLMAGSTVGQFDRQFFSRLDRDGSLISEFFEYRVLDVSTVKEIVKRWYGNDAVAPPGAKTHRVLTDIEDSIAELDFYMRNYFVPGYE